MTVLDPLNPLKNVTPRFKEEQLNDIREWFDANAKPILVINDAEPVNAVTIEQVEAFLALKKYHRRHFKYPNYGEIMKEAELLKAGVTRVLTLDQLIYMLDKFIIEPTIKHELKLAFQVFDPEDRNYVTVEQIRFIATEYGNPLNEEETRELVRDANVHGDGNVIYNDFVETMFSLCPELYNMKTEFLFENPDEDPSVPKLPEPPPPPPPPPVVEAPLPPPPPEPSKAAKKGKEKGGKGKGKK